jgi:uncharacterized protein YsxB (DUF464 family)
MDMTRVILRKRAGDIFSVDCSGHTGYGEEGEDIVCAALSSRVQTAMLGLLNIAGVNLSIERRDSDGILRFSLPGEMSDEQKRDCRTILNTMLLGIADLNENWSRFVRLEVKEK